MYPVPLPKKANIIQKSAIDEFIKKTLFNGEVSVTINKVSGLLNPNGLRIENKIKNQEDPDLAAAKANVQQLSNGTKAPQNKPH